YRAALQLYRKLTEEFPENPDYALAYAETYHWLFRPLLDSERLQEAEQVTREALALFEPLTVRFPRRPLSWAGVAACRINLGLVLARAGRFAEAEGHCLQGQALYARLSKEFPSQAVVYEAILASNLDWHGELLREAGRLPEAIARWREAQAVWEK